MTTAETTTTTDKKQEWVDAANEATAHQESIDPPPKRFRARLTVLLSDRELVEVGRKYSDAEAELEAFDDETKELAAERKASRAEIDGRRKKYRQIFSVGREDRDVECVEHISIRQGRKWRVRLDTKETYQEEPLGESDRQTVLPITPITKADLVHPDDPTDGQLKAALEEDGVESAGDEDHAGDEETDETDETDVNSPEALLEQAREGEEQ